jgi:hypothetical protein
MVALLVACPWSARAENARVRCYYTGTVGRAAVRAFLEFKGGEVEGEYSYGAIAHLPASPLALRGSVAQDGAAVLSEWESVIGMGTPVNTGEFKGKIAADRLRISGEWAGTNGKREPFSFEAYARVKEIHTSDPEIGVGFPELLATTPVAVLASKTLGGDLDRRVSEARDRGARLGVSYRLDYYSSRLIAIIEGFTMGDRRGGEAFVFADGPGGARRLSLDDVLRPGARERLAARALQEHERIQGTRIGYEPARIGVWTVVGKGDLEIHLVPNDENKDGPAPVTLARKEAAQFVDPASAIGYLFHGKPGK